MRARYYDPSTEQFTTVDPLAIQTRSPYGYAASDPINRTDPSGLCWSFGCALGKTQVGKFVTNTAAGVVNGITLGNGDAVLGAVGESGFYDKNSTEYGTGTAIGIGLDVPLLAAGADLLVAGGSASATAGTGLLYSPKGYELVMKGYEAVWPPGKPGPLNAAGVVLPWIVAWMKNSPCAGSG